jgi:hypothetical protein
MSNQSNRHEADGNLQWFFEFGDDGMDRYWEFFFFFALFSFLFANYDLFFYTLKLEDDRKVMRSILFYFILFGLIFFSH